jgi:hypothetical protein
MSIKEKKKRKHSLEVIFDKKKEKRINAIKIKKTRKQKRLVILNNKKKTKKQNKKKTFQINKNILQGGEKKALRELNKKVIKLNKGLITTNKQFNNNVKNFEKYFNYYEEYQTIIKNNYVSNSKRTISDFIRQLIDKKYIDNELTDIEDDLNIDRVKELEKIFRFRNKKAAYRHFYYKYMRLKLSKTITKSKDSKIKKKYDAEDTLWGIFAIFREYEFKMKKSLSEIKFTIKKMRDLEDQANDYMKDEDVPKLKIYEKFKISFDEEIKNVEQYEKDSIPIIIKYNENLEKSFDLHYYIKDINIKNINLLMLNHKSKLKTNTYAQQAYDKLGKFNSVAKPLALILSPFAALPGALTLGSKIGQTVFRGKRDFEDSSKLEAIKDKKIKDKYEKSNEIIYETAEETLDTFFTIINEVLNTPINKYHDKWESLNILYYDFHEVNTLFVYYPELRPYFDIGQISMLSYETFFDTKPSELVQKKLKDILYKNSKSRKSLSFVQGARSIQKYTKSKPDYIEKYKNTVYLSHRNYYNNILHLPNYLINHLKLQWLKQNYNDEYSKNKNSGEQNIKLTIHPDKSGMNMKDTFDKERANNSKDINFKLLYLSNNLISSSKQKIRKDKGNARASERTSALVTGTKEEKSSTKSNKNEFLFLPLSSFYALFSIDNFKEIKKFNIGDKIKVKKDDNLGKFLNMQKNVTKETYEKVFFINNNEHVILGTFHYLYKKIAFLTHFLFNNEQQSGSGEKTNLQYLSLVNTFFNDKQFAEICKDIDTIDEDSKDEGDKQQQRRNQRFLRRNLGIYNGIDSKSNYIMYALIVYSEHIKQLVEYINDLEYLSDKVEYYATLNQKMKNKIIDEYKKIKNTEIEEKNSKLIDNINEDNDEFNAKKRDIYDTIDDLPKITTKFTSDETFGSENIDELIKKDKNLIEPEEIYDDKYSRLLFYINHYLYFGNGNYAEISKNVESLSQQNNTYLTIQKYFEFVKGSVSKDYDSSIDDLYLTESEMMASINPKDIKNELGSLNIELTKPELTNRYNNASNIPENKAKNISVEIIYYTIIKDINNSEESEDNSKENKLKIYNKMIDGANNENDVFETLIDKNFNPIEDPKNIIYLLNDTYSDTPQSRHELFTKHYILYNNILFYKDSLLNTIKNNIKKMRDEKFSNNKTIKNNIEESISLLDTIIRKNKAIITNYFKFDKGSDVEKIYIIKTSDTSFEIKKIDEDDRRHIKERDQNKSKSFKDINSNECIYIIENEATVNNIPEYILYHSDFYSNTILDADISVDEKIKEDIKKFNDKWVYLALLNEIYDNKDTSSSIGNNKIIKFDDEYIPHQYLLFNKNYITKNIFNKKYVLKYQKHEYFNELDINEGTMDEQTHKKRYEYEYEEKEKKQEEEKTEETTEENTEENSTQLPIINEGKLTKVYESYLGSFNKFIENLNKINEKPYKNKSSIAQETDENNINEYQKKMRPILRKICDNIQKYCKVIPKTEVDTLLKK